MTRREMIRIYFRATKAVIADRLLDLLNIFWPVMVLVGIVSLGWHVWGKLWGWLI